MTAFQIIAIISLLISVSVFIKLLLRDNKKSVPSDEDSTSPAGKKYRSSTDIIAVGQPSAPANEGAAAHHQRGVAPTLKLAAQGASSASDRLAKKSNTSRPSSISSASKPPQSDRFANVPKSDGSTATKYDRSLTRLQELGLPTSTGTPHAAGNPSAPRTNTAELNSILERIDRFLEEEPGEIASTSPKPAKPFGFVDVHAKTLVMEDVPASLSPSPTPSPAPIPAAKAIDPSTAPTETAIYSSSTPTTTPAAAATPVAKNTPLWARADAVDEDMTKQDPPHATPIEGEQQRIF